MTASETQCRRLLWIFIITQLLFWSLIPWLTRHNLPFDTIEGIAWGNQWQWGYDKHPPLAAALCTLFSKIATGYPVYLLAQLAVVSCYYAVWRLLKNIFTPAHALVAVVILSSIWYYTIATPKINPNTLMTPVWMLSAWAFYHSFQSGTTRSWLITGIMAGVCMLTKFESAVMLIAMLALLVCTQHGRQHFKQPGLYWALLVFLAIWSPNLYWNSQHNWSEIQYALGRGGDYKNVSHGIASHFFWPSYFLLQQLGSLALALILIACLWIWPRSQERYSQTDRYFLGFLGLGPLVVTMGISFVFGMYLYSKWATPYFSLLPAFIIACRPPNISSKGVKTYVIIGLICIGLSALIRGGFLLYGPQITGKARPDAYFPGKQIATKIDHLWQQRQHTPLTYIAGSHYLVANISVYSQFQPKPYFDWSHAQSAWANDNKLTHHGAMFAWWDPNKQGLPKAIAKRFPNAQYLGDFSFNKVTPINAKPVVIGIAYLPPQTL